jgi:YVTN family beta-propeller protein
MNRILARTFASLVLLALPAISTAEEPSANSMKVVKTIKLGGDGGWDYLTLDAAARRLYISRASRVMVMDVDDGKLVGEVADTKGVHGIAIDAKRNQGFTSNGGDNTVTIFDLKTLKETSKVKVGTGPDSIIYDPASDRVFTLNGRGKSATAISAETGKVDGTIELGGKPEAAVVDEKGQFFVNLEDKAEVVQVDAKNLKVMNRWPVEKTPVGLGMDRVKRRLFVSCRSQKMVILDADTGKVLETLPIGKGTDACVFDQSTGLAYSSNGDGTLTVIEEKPADTYKVAANVKTQDGAKTMALDTKTHSIFLATAKFKPAAGGGRRQTEPDSFVIVVVGK